MSRACRHLLLALAALVALGWGATSAPAGEVPQRVIAGVVAAVDSHHGEARAHCATGAGAGCQVPALNGAAAAMILPHGPARAAPPIAVPGAALARPGPLPPVPIG